MMQRWSKYVTDTLRTLGRRGGLFIMASLVAVTLTLTPVMTRPAHAQLGNLLSLGGSLTNGLSSCAIETVGWVICPTMRSIARLADYGFAYINKNFLRVDSNISNTSSGTFKAWQTMLTIANALFVIAFMTLVYSQLTGRNSGGYNIKRLLPRLVIAAIAINLSFYICAILVEISNILGDSLLTILNNLASGIGKPIMPINMDSGPTSSSDGVLVTITSQIMGRSSVAWVLMAPIAAVTITIATLCGAMIVLLIMRKTIIAVLILTSPILFVAYLLPNLERFFFQAFRLFIQLLLLYPILALLLGAGQIVSTTISATGNNDANYKTTNDWYIPRTAGAHGSAIADLTASAAAVLPLLGVWFFFKNTSSIMNAAGTRLSATMAGRRGDKEARVTGRAVEGAAAAKNLTGLSNPLNRRQAFTRGRRRASPSGSALTENRSPRRNDGLQAGIKGSANLSDSGIEAGLKDKSVDVNPFLDQPSNTDTSNMSDVSNTSNTLNQSELNQVSQKGAGEKMTTAIFGAKGRDKDDKQVTAKDLFNSLNRDRMGHTSKDKERQFGAGPAPAGASGGQPTAGSSGPVAPTTGYRAPEIAQNAGIISGSAASSAPAQIIAVPVQVDASTLLGKNNSAPISDIVKPPVTSTEKDAEARANKYLFDAQRDLDDARNRQDILGRKDDDPPTEQPHVAVQNDGEKERSD